MYLPDELLELPSRHVAAHRPGSDPSRWMFEATPGQPPHQNTVGHMWRQARLRAGITGVTLHDLLAGVLPVLADRVRTTEVS